VASVKANKSGVNQSSISRPGGQVVFENALRANIDETESAAINYRAGGQENHRERNQECSSFPSQCA
jgi:hypothetical protein